MNVAKFKFLTNTSYRHSHGIVDALFSVFTKFFFGTKTTPGLPEGIRNMTEWDEKIKVPYDENQNFVVKVSVCGIFDCGYYTDHWSYLYSLPGYSQTSCFVPGHILQRMPRIFELWHTQ